VSIGTVGASEVQTGAGGIQAVPLPVTAVTIGTLTLSPDGRYLAVSGSNGTAEVWDVRTLEPLSVLKGASQVDALAFSPQGAVIATGDDAGVIRVWDVTSGTLLAVFRGHTDYVNSVAFSDDGRLLVSAGADGTVRIWDAVTGDDLAVLGKADDSLSGVWTYAVNTAAFSDDRRGIVAGLADGTTHVYRCEVCGSLSDLLTLAQSRRVRDLSLLERERYLP
jgi:WD40 repeat protein